MGFNNVYTFIPDHTAFIELSLSAAQTASSGDVVIFDTVRASHTHGVSVDASGNISLDTEKAYWIQASIDVTRSSTTSSWEFAFCDSSGTAISASSGGFEAQWVYHDSATTDAQPNATFTATYVSSSPLSSINLKAITLAASSTVNDGTRVIIIEQGVS